MGKVLSCFAKVTTGSERNEGENTGPDIVNFARCPHRQSQCSRCEAERDRENFVNRQIRRWDNYGPEPELGKYDYIWIPTPPPRPRVGARFNPSYYK